MIPYPLIKIKHGGFNECTPDLDMFNYMLVLSIPSDLICLLKEPTLFRQQTIILEKEKSFILVYVV
jgi:hypothetical protein